MNPIRSLAPDLVANDFTTCWVYLAGPLHGAGHRQRPNFHWPKGLSGY
jgi:hypothetical protein